MINGEKKWIGNGTIADVVVVWARDADGRQVKGFLVEKGTPGYDARAIEGKGSLRAVWQAEIDLDRRARPGREPAARARTASRTPPRCWPAPATPVAWAALGHAAAGYDVALTYASAAQPVRQAAGRGSRSSSSGWSGCSPRSPRCSCTACSSARLEEAEALPDTIAALAKMNNTRKAREVLAEARDLLGGNGILLDYHVIRHMADIEAIHTFEGTETIQTLIVGRDITGVGAFT